MRKSRKKINLKLINYSNILFQTHYTYFNYVISILNKIQFPNLLTNLNYIYIFFYIFHDKIKHKKIIYFFFSNFFFNTFLKPNSIFN